MPARIVRRRRDGLVQIGPARFTFRVRLARRFLGPAGTALVLVVLGAVAPGMAFPALTVAIVLRELGKLRSDLHQQGPLELVAERPRLAVVPGRPER